MRVISGSWKGRRLKSPSSDAVRPTTDRVKEAMFNILGPSVRDGLFLDLCCGAGGLGIEALSRGAARVIFVDSDRRSLALARENLGICGAEAGRFELVCADAVTWFGGWNPPQDAGNWILAADPPYHGPVAGAIMSLLEGRIRDPGFLAGIIEYGSRTDDPLPAARNEAVWTVRRYGESQLAVVRPAHDSGEGE